MLSGSDNLFENIFDIRHIEVAAEQKRARAPVVATQERMCEFHAAAACGAVAQVSHVDLPDERNIVVNLIGRQRI